MTILITRDFSQLTTIELILEQNDARRAADYWKMAQQTGLHQLHVYSEKGLRPRVSEQTEAEIVSGLVHTVASDTEKFVEWALHANKLAREINFRHQLINSYAR